MATVLAIDNGVLMGGGVPVLGPGATCMDVAKRMGLGLVEHVLARTPWQPLALVSYNQQASLSLPPTTNAFVLC